MEWRAEHLKWIDVHNTLFDRTLSIGTFEYFQYLVINALSSLHLFGFVSSMNTNKSMDTHSSAVFNFSWHNGKTLRINVTRPNRDLFFSFVVLWFIEIDCWDHQIRCRKCAIISKPCETELPRKNNKIFRVLFNGSAPPIRSLYLRVRIVFHYYFFSFCSAYLVCGNNYEWWFIKVFFFHRASMALCYLFVCMCLLWIMF